ncbi:MAG: P-type ATPase, translocating [Microgenomates group bacterium Gr01-1014_16]|nr:MAG: P-type ATPase, translocating [Microgenomates group bacterium Gr01-1014_16]
MEAWEQGLSWQKAEEGLNQFGANEIRASQVGWWELLARQFKSPLVYLLVGAAAVDAILGELIESGVILGIVFVNAGLGFFQEFRSEQALKLLKKYTASKARVIRDGGETIIAAVGVVPGDTLVAIPGDILAADVKWLKTEGLEADESILSGESQMVEKSVGSQGLSGTSVVRGKGFGLVTATGKNTVWGKTAKETVETVQTSSFEKDIGKFSKFILRIIGVTLALVFAVNMLAKSGTVSWTELALFSIALAVSVIPEALPVVITFSLSRGALRLAKNKVVVKRLAAVEDLGNIEILCTDKTGTLTENKLALAGVWGEKEKVLWLAGISCLGTGHDPIDTAIWESLPKQTQKKLQVEVAMLDEIPFDPVSRTMQITAKWKGKKWEISRGVEEKISIDSPEATKWSQEMGLAGKRIIAVGVNGRGAGLMAFSDPVKSSTISAIRNAEKLGLAIKILTGDSPAVAGSVAREIGLVSDSLLVIRGDELDKMGVKEQHTAVEKYAVFARVTPTQKNKIIDLLQEKYRVGYLGEGINDGPALKSADVGLVVDHASDVGRDAADIILLKKDLKIIVDGIEEGRIVTANTRKYLLATMASNFGNFYAVSIASLVINFLPMLPIQILLLNLLSDLPMVSIATDNVDRHDVARPMPFDLKNLLATATVLGIVSTVFDFMFFGLFFKSTPATLQTAWFMGSVLTELVFLYSIRTKKFFLTSRAPSWPIWILTGLAAVLAVGIPLTKFGAEAFKFTKLPTESLFLVFGVVAAYLATTESVKLWYYNWRKN